MVGGGGVVGAGDHTAPGRQPLSSNPLSDVMTLSNLDHLLKHVPGAVSVAALVSRPPSSSSSPPSQPARPAQSRAGCWVAPRCQEAGTRTQFGGGGRHTHARTENSPRREREKTPPSHRNPRGRRRRKGESEGGGGGERSRRKERGRASKLRVAKAE